MLEYVHEIYAGGRVFVKSKKWTVGLLVFYLIALLWILIFKFSFSIADVPHLRNINLIPFGDSVIVNGTVDYSEMIQNLLAFIPYGLFVHILWEHKPLWQQFIPMVCTSLLVETVQFIFAVGASDITDVITNSLGGIIGVLTAIGFSKVCKKNWVSIINILALIAAVLLTLLIAVLLLANM